MASRTTTISGQIQGFIKGGAYFGSISLKQEVWGTQSLRSYRVTSFLKRKMIPIMKFASHIATDAKVNNILRFSEVGGIQDLG